MPLTSRASSARALRTQEAASKGAASEETAPETNQTQPRRPSTATTKTAPVKDPPAATPDAPPAQANDPDRSNSEESADAARRQGRPAGSKDREPRARTKRSIPVTASGEIIDKAALRKQMAELTAAAKVVRQSHVAAVRDLESVFVQKHQELMEQHRALAIQLSEAEFSS